MLPYELLHQINMRLQELKCNKKLFRCINVLLFGDLMQLPPVVGNPVYIQPEEMEGTLHLFQQFNFCELKEIVRQQGDRTFIDLLNNLRGQLTDEQYDLLIKKKESSKLEGPFKVTKNYIVIDYINYKMYYYNITSYYYSLDKHFVSFLLTQWLPNTTSWS